MNYGIVEPNYTPTPKQISCIDAGTENCPCYLALTGDCLICSRLQGKDFCNCDWEGVCIYNEFVQGNRKINNPRREFEARIIQKKFYKQDLVVYILEVGKGFAMKASRPGSYLFIRGSGTDSFYDIPISVMKADVEKGQIHLAIKIISTKTKALLMENETLTLRGPYRNGIHGITAILRKKGKNQKTLIIAKGIGIAPGILTLRALQAKGSVDMVADTEKISMELIEDYFEQESAGNNGSIDNGSIEKRETVRYLSLAEKDSGKALETLMAQRQYDNMIVLASDYYIENIGRMVKKILPASDLAVSNNFKICCGEGLCGSCSIGTPSGNTIKMCKCRMTGENFLNNVFYSISSL